MKKNKNMKKTFKFKKNNIIYLLIIFLYSCNEAGTLNKIDKGNNEDIEIYKYYYEYGSYVYITRFKNCPNVVTTTWKEQQGNNLVTKGNILIMENDSINIKKQ